MLINASHYIEESTQMVSGASTTIAADSDTRDTELPSAADPVTGSTSEKTDLANWH